jgi:peptidoglycan/xylan/chitin deacetylase (PgdA/CDA1 family)
VTPTALSRGEFSVVATDRLLSLLDRYRLKATWFVPGHTIDTYPGLCAQICEAGHEIGHHGYLHEAPRILTREQEIRALERGSACIERLTGDAPAGYRSPAFELSEHTIELLAERGFTYDSSMMGNDHQPYRCRDHDVVAEDGTVVFGEPTEVWELPVSWSLDDFTHFEYDRGLHLHQGLACAEDVLANWVDDFRYLVREAHRGMLTYTMHPCVIGRGHRMMMLERLIAEISDLGARFERMSDALELLRT